MIPARLANDRPLLALSLILVVSAGFAVGVMELIETDQGPESAEPPGDDSAARAAVLQTDTPTDATSTDAPADDETTTQTQSQTATQTPSAETPVSLETETATETETPGDSTEAEVLMAPTTVTSTPKAIGASLGATSDRPEQTISACGTIDDPGNYVLDGDFNASGNGTCLTIRSSDVLLDGAGHSITGLNGTANGSAIHIAGDEADLTDVTVRNVSVASWERGIVLRNVTSSTVRDVTLAENGEGMMLTFVTSTEVVDSAVIGSTERGIVMNSSHENALRSLRVVDNGESGFHLYGSGSNRNVLAGNTVAGNDAYGMLIESSLDNRLQNNTIDDNDAASVLLSGNMSASTALQNNTVNSVEEE